MFLRSLQWRLVSIITAVTIALMVFVGIFLNKEVEGNYYKSFKKSITNGFKYWSYDGSWTYDKLKHELSNNDGARDNFNITEDYKSFAILTMDGAIKYAAGKKFSERDQSYQSEVLSSYNLLEVLKGKEVSAEKKLTRTQESIFFDYAAKIALSDGDCIIYFRYDQEAWGDTITEFTGIIVKSLLIAVIAAIIIGFLLSRTITIPIGRVMQKAERIALGDFGEVLEVQSDDEIGKLMSTFNYMAVALKSTLSEISREKSKMEAIFNFMTDGVLAFNMNGGLIVANPTATNLLGLDENHKITFDQFSSDYLLGVNLREIEAFEDISTKERNIKANDKYLKLYFATVLGDDKKVEGIVVVLQDCTEQQKLENMRREFVANVSHELRTPLTSIKSYTETLIDGAIEDRETAERFLSVIDSEADRMTRLVKDLLQLSRLDNQQLQWNMHEVDFVALVRSCVDKMQMEAMSKKHTLKSFVIGNVPLIVADSDRIEQVMINVISNAIKYTPENGEIIVYIGVRHSEVYAKVTDTGIGIPEEDISRIFDRFYRVDKARSRDMGGTGLGLAIAKEIVEAHGGNINISSQLEKGTEVTVTIPLRNV